ncbi:MAG: hypothetical protein JOZ92_04695, partial [Candidatus Dormibacteraeota bacterium]|nr:hypothetical protein [Candidatus Dormibacteraeota bacterium]
MRIRLLAAGLVAAGAALVAPVTVLAHSLPQTEVPSEGSTVQQAPHDVEITFGEVPDPQLSS